MLKIYSQETSSSSYRLESWNTVGDHLQSKATLIPGQAYARASSPSPDSKPPYGDQSGFTRDADFWFEDGNVVIIADRTAFRIHQSILRRHTDLIADHLEINSRWRDDADEDYVVVRVSDSAKSFKGLLRLLYPGPSE